MAKSTSKLFQSEEPKEMKEDAMNLPESQLSDTPLYALVKQSANEVTNDIADDIQDIDLSAIKKKRFRINGDSNKIIEINTSDLNIASRLQAAYERLQKYMENVADILGDVTGDETEITEEQEKIATEQLKQIDTKMREEVDYIFDAPVSDICCEGGSMYDPFEGMFRFEHIIDALSKLYENNLNSEFTKMKRRVSARTSKYTKKYHK